MRAPASRVLRLQRHDILDRTKPDKPERTNEDIPVGRIRSVLPKSARQRPPCGRCRGEGICIARCILGACNVESSVPRDEAFSVRMALTALASRMLAALEVQTRYVELALAVALVVAPLPASAVGKGCGV